jgi:hypothetical protein
VSGTPRLAAGCHDPVEVHLDDRRAVGRGAATLEHVLGDSPPHRRHRLAALAREDVLGGGTPVRLACGHRGGRGGLGLIGRLDVQRPLGLGRLGGRLRRLCLAPRFDQGDEVALADPPADPGALDLREVDAVLVSHPADDRRVEA